MLQLHSHHVLPLLNITHTHTPSSSSLLHTQVKLGQCTLTFPDKLRVCVAKYYYPCGDLHLFTQSRVGTRLPYGESLIVG